MSSQLITQIVFSQLNKNRETNCEICEHRTATHNCKLCNRRVCINCFDKESNMCAVCIKTLCDECHKSISIDTCVICGKKICRSCSIDLDYARRICITCNKKVESPKRYIEEKTIAVLEKLVVYWSQDFV